MLWERRRVRLQGGLSARCENPHRLCGQHGRDQDFLVYPIIFLYRHHVELMLKRIIRQVPSLIDGRLSEKQREHLEKHRLDLLWEDLRGMLPALCKAAG